MIKNLIVLIILSPVWIFFYIIMKSLLIAYKIGGFKVNVNQTINITSEEKKV